MVVFERVETKVGGNRQRYTLCNRSSVGATAAVTACERPPKFLNTAYQQLLASTTTMAKSSLFSYPPPSPTTTRGRVRAYAGYTTGGQRVSC